MNDQASLLRAQVERSRGSRKESIPIKEARTLAVVSGKGGVGKSNFSLNFSITLQKKGYNVLLFDLDIGMANIDILMGMTQRYSIVHLFTHGFTMQDIIQKGPENLSYIAGGSGLRDIFQFDEKKRGYFLAQLQEMSYQYDFILFDMGAGISEDSLQLLLSVDEMFLLTTCEPTSLTDAYSALKYIHMHDHAIPFHLVLNKVLDRKIAESTVSRLQAVMSQFLNRSIQHLGSIPDDRHVSLAVMDQTPFVLKYPASSASKEIARLTQSYLQENNSSDTKNTSTFMTRLRRLFG